MSYGFLFPASQGNFKILVYSVLINMNASLGLALCPSTKTTLQRETNNFTCEYFLKEREMGKKKIAMEKIEDKQSRTMTFSRRKNGLFKKAKDFSNLSGSSVAILVISPAGHHYTYACPSPSFDSVVDQFLSEIIDDDPLDDQFLPTTTNAGSTSIDSEVDQFLPTAATSPSYDSMINQFLSTAPGSPSVDSTTYQFQPIAATNSNRRSFRNTLKALSDNNLEACNNLEELMGLKNNLEQLIRERKRLI